MQKTENNRGTNGVSGEVDYGPNFHFSKRYSLRSAERASDFQFQLTSLREFTPSISLERRCPQ